MAVVREVLRCSVVSELPWKAGKQNFSPPELKTELLRTYPVAFAIFPTPDSALQEGKLFSRKVGSAV